MIYKHLGGYNQILALYVPKTVSIVDSITKLRIAGSLKTTDRGYVHDYYFKLTLNGELFKNLNTVTKSGERI
jgi:hypothetical protein